MSLFTTTVYTEAKEGSIVDRKTGGIRFDPPVWLDEANEKSYQLKASFACLRTDTQLHQPLRQLPVPERHGVVEPLECNGMIGSSTLHVLITISGIIHGIIVSSA